MTACLASRAGWRKVLLLTTLTPTELGAGLQLEGEIDRQGFDTFVTEALAPTLRPGQIVVLDNLAVHKGATARRLIEARGCRLLFLPPYSPDFNPIEHAFAKLKEYLRRAGARTEDALHAALAAALATITAADARGWFRHCGYPLSKAQPLC